MDSTLGKFGESIPTGTTENGKNNMAQSKELGHNHGEAFETPSTYNEIREDEAREPTGIDTSVQFSPPRQLNEDEITAQQRAQREEEESLELARALMAEEAMAAYAQSIDYLRSNQDQFSEEDLAALQAAMDDEQHQHEVEINADAEEAIDEDDNGDSYEFMLRLGERMGDVKSERWAQVAQQKIDKLSIVQFDPATVNEKDANDCDVKCLVCQEEYCKGEYMRQLPCGHCFHKDCVDQWLLSKDFCPYCRTTLDKE